MLLLELKFRDLLNSVFIKWMSAWTLTYVLQSPAKTQALWLMFIATASTLVLKKKRKRPRLQQN